MRADAGCGKDRISVQVAAGHIGRLTCAGNQVTPVPHGDCDGARLAGTDDGQSLTAFADLQVTRLSDGLGIKDPTSILNLLIIMKHSDREKFLALKGRSENCPGREPGVGSR